MLVKSLQGAFDRVEVVVYECKRRLHSKDDLCKLYLPGYKYRRQLWEVINTAFNTKANNRRSHCHTPIKEVEGGSVISAKGWPTFSTVAKVDRTSPKKMCK